MFSSLLEEHRARLKDERERACYAYDARYQAIGRIGLPQVREASAQATWMPNIRREWPRWSTLRPACRTSTVLMLRIGPEAARGWPIPATEGHRA